MTEKRRENIYGRRLCEARVSYGLSLIELGTAVALDESGSSSRISRYENGIHQPKLLTQQLFAKALELPLSYFFIEEDEAALLILTPAHAHRAEYRRAKIGKKARK